MLYSFFFFFSMGLGSISEPLFCLFSSQKSILSKGSKVRVSVDGGGQVGPLDLTQILNLGAFERIDFFDRNKQKKGSEIDPSPLEYRLNFYF